jgi:hypothetical protein
MWRGVFYSVGINVSMEQTVSIFCPEDEGNMVSRNVIINLHYEAVCFSETSAQCQRWEEAG